MSSGGDLKAAFIGGVTGAAGGLIGASSAFGNVGDVTASRVLAHGAVGGLSSKAQGGKFVSGFVSSAFAKSLSGKIQRWAGNNDLKGVLANATVGGTASRMGGGKFANGAITSSFQYIVNQLASDRPKLHKSIITKAKNGTLLTPESMMHDASEFSRVSGYLSTGFLALGLAPASAAAGSLSLGSGGLATFLDYYINGSNMNETSAVGTIMDAGHFALQPKVLRLMLGPLKTPVHMTMDIFDRVQSEAMYQAAKNDGRGG